MKNPFGIRRTARALAFGSAVICALAALVVWQQERLIFPGVSFKKSSGPFQLLLSVTAVRVNTSDGESLQAFTSIRSVGQSEYVALIFHGNGETAETQNFIPFFNRVGIPALTFDYRGYGRSTGWPSEQGLYRDAEAAAEKVRELSGLDFDRFVLLGNSIGAGPAAYLARKIQPRALILLAGYSDFRSLVATMPPYSYLTPFLRYQFPVAEYLRGLSTQCVVLAHGRKDQVVPFENLAQLTKAIPQGVSLSVLESEEASHNDIFYKVEEQLVERTKDCLGAL